MVNTITVSQATKHWRELLEWIRQANEEVVVTRYGEPVLRLLPIQDPEAVPLEGGTRPLAFEELPRPVAYREVERAPIHPSKRARTRIPGIDRGRVQIADDFNAPLPDDTLRSFEGD